MLYLAIQIGCLLLTLLMIGTVAGIGRFLGGRRLGRTIVLYGIAGTAAWFTAQAALDANWYEPLGLVTPVAASTVAAIVALITAGRIFRGGPTERPLAPVNRFFGGVLGTMIGGVIAIAAWLLLPLLVAAPSASARHRSNTAQTAIAAIANQTNRDFLHHVPLVGDVSREVLALVEILQADASDHRRIVERFDLESIRSIPAMQAALNSSAVQRDLQRLRRGSLLALFRLQQHPRIIAVAESEEVAARFDELLPTRIVAALHGGN